MPVVRTDARRIESVRYERLYVPRTTLLTAWGFLRDNGRLGLEQLCFLAGRPVVNGAGRNAQVTCCVLPLTVASNGYVTLTGHQQTALILDVLEARDEVPLLSLHTHGDGGSLGCGPQHSEIDDHGVALTPEDGLFSGIVPYYALGSPFEFSRVVSLYERCGGKWLRLSEEEKERRLLVHDDTVRLVPSRAPRDQVPTP